MNLWKRRDESLSDEIQDYLDRETRDNIVRGMSPADARAAARRKLGNPTRVKEDTRVSWGLVWIEQLFQDLYHGARMFLKNPAFTAIAILSIALGTGANAAMFSAVDGLLLRPLPVDRPGEVVTIGALPDREDDSQFNMSYRDYVDVRDRSRGFHGLLAYSYLTAAFDPDPENSAGEAAPKVLLGLAVTGNYFDVLRVRPALGRTFRPEEDQVRSRDAVIVLDYEVWQREFAADPSVLGRVVKLNGVEFTVIGITPEGFPGLNQFGRIDFYFPTMMWPEAAPPNPSDPLEDRNLRYMTVKGRLKPDVGLEEARAEIAAIGESLEQAYPDTNRRVALAVRTELQTRFEQSPPIAVFSVMAAVLAVAVLLVACANLAGLLLSRAPVRSREIALRMAVGAPRIRLIRQLLTENLLLAIMGGLCGLAMGWGVIRVLRQYQVFTDLPINITFAFDARVTAFSLAVAVASVFLFGFLPALQTARVDLTSAIKNSGAASAQQRPLWGRNLLVSVQVAVALVLLTLAASVYRSFAVASERGPGYRTDHLLLMTLNPSLVRYTPTENSQFLDDLLEETRALPGVASAALTSTVPMSLVMLDAVAMVPEASAAVRESEDEATVHIHLGSFVDESYFDTMQIRLIRGRAFRPTDDPDASLVAVVNQTLADRYWPGEDPIGKRFRRDSEDGPWVEVAGVVATTKYMLPQEPPSPYVYLPIRQYPSPRQITLVVESAGDPAGLAAPLRGLIRSLDREQPVFDVVTMERFYENSAVSLGRLENRIVGGMGFTGLALSMIGLYGLVAYSANRRTREIGIRMALGATTASILHMILRQGVWLAVAGVVAGLIASRGLDASMRSAFQDVEVTDPSVYFFVAPALWLVTLLGALIPARRAARIDPTVALRYE